jgi:multimeric flavodoxin WrbA
LRKLLAVIGSPRKQGNTHAMVLGLLEGAKACGAESEIVFLGDLDIAECNGCLACWKTGRCAKNDDMNKLYDLIALSDAIVFGTPVYWYGPTALMKAFLDRFVYFNCPENRGKVKNKDTALIIPFEEDDPRAADLVIALFEKSFAYLEMNFVGTVIAPGLLHKGEVANKPPVMQQTVELGKKLAEAISC